MKEVVEQTQSLPGRTVRAGRRAPWRVFAPHHGRPFAFFLDRADDAAWSFAGSSPSSQLIVAPDRSVRLWEGERWRPVGLDPIAAIDAYVEASAAPARSLPAGLDPRTALPRTVGYLAYELGAAIERVPAAGPDPVQLPLAVLSTYDVVDAWSARGGTGRIEFDVAASNSVVPAWPEPAWAPSRPRSEHDALARYRRGFGRILSAIRAGDIYQANLSRQLVFDFDEDPARAYARLRRRQPMPQGAYLDLGPTQLLSNSPELFLRVHRASIETRPIKGTRPRYATPSTDRRAIVELTSDPKEAAEHVMIVDLERNDLGRVCATGSVRVADYARVESFATVHHLVSTVCGVLREKSTLADLLRATFPSGSITGAPKIRSMEIIAEVEAHARGVYTGAIGCFNGGRSLELSVAIRTAVVHDSRIHYSTGGGIVADSRLASELEETVTKARAFLDCLNGGIERLRALA